MKKEKINIYNAIIFDDKYAVVFTDKIIKGKNKSYFSIRDKIIFGDELGKIKAPELSLQNIEYNGIYGVRYQITLIDSMFTNALNEFLNHK